MVRPALPTIRQRIGLDLETRLGVECGLRVEGARDASHDFRAPTLYDLYQPTTGFDHAFFRTCGGLVPATVYTGSTAT